MSCFFHFILIIATDNNIYSGASVFVEALQHNKTLCVLNLSGLLESGYWQRNLFNGLFDIFEQETRLAKNAKHNCVKSRLLVLDLSFLCNCSRVYSTINITRVLKWLMMK